MSDPDTELYYAEMEAARNSSLEAYFEARPQLHKTIEQMTLFRAGFERAWSMLWHDALRARAVKGQSNG